MFLIASNHSQLFPSFVKCGIIYEDIQRMVSENINSASSPFIYYYYECVPTASSLSELSSLHDGGNTDFRHTYQTVQMKALPPIADLDERSVLRAAPPTHNRRHRRDRGNHSDDELDRR